MTFIGGMATGMVIVVVIAALLVVYLSVTPE